MTPSPARSRHPLGDPVRLPRSAEELDARLRAAWAKRKPLLAKTEMLRAAHGEADGLPGLAVDVLAPFAVLHWYGARGEFDGVAEPLLDALAAALPVRGVYLKVRAGEASKVRESDKAALCPRAPVRGEAAPAERIAREGDLRFALRLGEGFSYGVFPDQRDNRARVRKSAEGRRVLNLFAYTGGFTLAAAAGGAASTVTVDAAASACKWAERNFALNGLERGERHRIVRADAFDFLRRAAKKGETYGLVVCDPPGFSTVGGRRWSAARDLPELLAACLAATSPGAALLLTINVHGIPGEEFEAAVRAALPAGARARFHPPPPDFPSPPGAAHLKTAWIELAGACPEAVHDGRIPAEGLAPLPPDNGDWTPAMLEPWQSRPPKAGAPSPGAD